MWTLDWSESQVTAPIEATHLCRAFGDTLAVDDVSIRVEAGQVYGLLGPDGAGKTTTMRLLCGALELDSGDVFLAGIDLKRRPDHARSHLGYLPQRFSLYGELTVQENLRFFAEVRGVSPGQWQERTLSILEFVGLAQFVDRRAERLSGGMKQKLGLAAALVHQPQILILDEPTGGVDPVTRQSFWQLIIRLLEDGVAVLVSTPYMDEAARCNKVGFMKAGRLSVEGSPEELVEVMEGRVAQVVVRPRAQAAAALREVEWVQEVGVLGDRLHVRLRPDPPWRWRSALKRTLKRAGLKPGSVEPLEATLEDAFVDLLEISND
jgi:ABC-2 type transport system ATP-binding protein